MPSAPPDLRVLADDAVDREAVAHLLDRHRHQIRMLASHRDELVGGVAVAVELHFGFEVRQDGRQVRLIDGELELAARLENFVAFRRFADFQLDVKQAVAYLDVGLVGVHGQEVGLRRHLARFLQHRAGVPHLLFDEVDHTLSEYAEFSAWDDLCSVGRRNGGVLDKWVRHGGCSSIERDSSMRYVTCHWENGCLIRFELK